MSVDLDVEEDDAIELGDLPSVHDTIQKVVIKLVLKHGWIDERAVWDHTMPKIIHTKDNGGLGPFSDNILVTDIPSSFADALTDLVKTGLLLRFDVDLNGRTRNPMIYLAAPGVSIRQETLP